MKLRNVKAVLLQDLYQTKASLEVIFDIFLFSLSNIVLFGFISRYLSGGNNVLEVESLFIAVIFWEVIRISQYSTSVSTMWNVWSHNLSNMFIAPVKTAEYLLAHNISSMLKSSIVLIASMLLSFFIFDLNIFNLGVFPVLFSYFNMILFATSFGLVILGLIFQYGTRIQALSWGLIFAIQPFCAVFFPVHVLPSAMQVVSYFFPVTFFFEWLRALHTGIEYSLGRLSWAFIYNILWFLAATFIFSRQLAAAKRSGQFVRNDL